MTDPLLDPSAEPLLDHRRLDLEAAERVSYRVEQTFRYSYDSPVTAVRQRLVFVPRSRHGDQHRRRHLVSVLGATARQRTRADRAGNTVLRIIAPQVPDRVEFRLVAILERVCGDGPPRLAAGALTDPRLLRPTRLTTPDARLRQLAADVTRGVRDPVERAERINTAVRAALTYRFGVTDVQTTAAEALAGGHGVCQDYAHVMLTLCRLVGLPARYISGHLLGEGASHAWVEVIVPAESGRAVTEAVALAFDPCNGRRAGKSYVTVATGRDYADVPPTSGTYVGAPGGRLTSAQRVGVLAVDAAPSTLAA